MDSSREYDSGLGTESTCQQKAGSQFGASQHTTLSEDFTGTCFGLNGSSRPKNDQAQALSQSTVCGPWAGRAQKQLQPASRKRTQDEVSGLEARSSKRPFAVQSVNDAASYESDDCDGEEEVQSKYKAAALLNLAPHQSTLPLPKSVQLQQVHRAPKQNSMGQINFPVLRRASAGCKTQVNVPIYVVMHAYPQLSIHTVE